MISLDGAALAAHLREDAGDILALLPAVRRSAEREREDTGCIDALERAAARILRASQNLAAYTLLCGTPPPALPVQLSALADGLCAEAKAVCGGSAIACRSADFSLWTLGSARLLAIVLCNLLQNSLLYAAEAPRASVSLSRQNGGVTLCVSDAGKGMRPAAAEAAFAPWSSTNPYGDSACGEGLGLGLALAQRYAAVYGGRLATESSFGSGTRITLWLPLCDAFGGAAPDYSALCRGPAGVPYTQLAGLRKF